MEEYIMQKKFIEQVIITLNKKDKGNYFLLIGMGTLLNFNIKQINEIIEVVRTLRRVQGITKKQIINFIFQNELKDENEYF